jgi:hypothetical protein
MTMIEDFVEDLAEAYKPGSHCEDPTHTGCPKCDEDAYRASKGVDDERDDLDFNDE